MTGNPKNDADKHDQALQINENTIDDPETPEVDRADKGTHSRTDVPKQDQALQINENTIDDQS